MLYRKVYILCYEKKRTRQISPFMAYKRKKRALKEARSLNSFIKRRNLDLDGRYTVLEFHETPK